MTAAAGARPRRRAAMRPTTEDLREMYRRMVRIRAFEERATALFQAGELPGFLHSSVGQEAVPVGATFDLGPDDYITSNHRGHGHVMAKGMSPRAMFAELYGKAEGSNRGRGGSMHIMSFAIGVIGANGIVGAGIPIAAGAALSAVLRRTDQVAVCFFGDGGANNGAFHEGINLAAVWDLPCVFVCENNQYAESTPQASTTRVARIADRAAAYGIPGERVDGNDVAAVYAAASRAIARARRGEGPSLIEAVTYRWYGHYIGDPAVYRADDEVAEWKGRDPVARLRRVLREGHGVAESELAAVEAAEAAEVDEAAAWAQALPDPDPATAFEDVYGPEAGGEGT
jgi:TPP-dependent pyruvate/acetoin dehydrogenase alpha subunit